MKILVQLDFSYIISVKNFKKIDSRTNDKVISSLFFPHILVKLKRLIKH